MRAETKIKFDLLVELLEDEYPTRIFKDCNDCELYLVVGYHEKEIMNDVRFCVRKKTQIELNSKLFVSIMELLRNDDDFEEYRDELDRYIVDCWDPTVPEDLEWLNEE